MAEMTYALLRALDRSAAALRRLGLGHVTRIGRTMLEGLGWKGITIEVEGLPLSGGIRDRSFLYRLMDGTFEPQTMQILLQWLRPGSIVLDVGAYLGYYTILASQRIGEAGQVYAFEPDPMSFDWLQRNLRRNNCRNVVALQKALSDTTGVSFLYRHATDPSKSSLAPTKGWDKRLMVQADTADRMLESVSVDVIKIDAEGAEPFVLAGMTKLLERSRDPALFIELNPRTLRDSGSSAEELLAILRRLRFTHVEFLDQELDKDGQLLLCNLYCRR